jgi:hypothetical protein
MGAAGNFIGQMGFFALAHVFMISWFATKMKKINWQYFFGDAVVVLPVLITAYLLVVPHAPAGVIKIGVHVMLQLFLLCYTLVLLPIIRPKRIRGWQIVRGV